MRNKRSGGERLPSIIQEVFSQNIHSTIEIGVWQQGQEINDIPKSRWLHFTQIEMLVCSLTQSLLRPCCLISWVRYRINISMCAQIYNMTTGDQPGYTTSKWLLLSIREETSVRPWLRSRGRGMQRASRQSMTFLAGMGNIWQETQLPDEDGSQQLYHRHCPERPVHDMNSNGYLSSSASQFCVTFSHSLKFHAVTQSKYMHCLMFSYLVYAVKGFDFAQLKQISLRLQTLAGQM